MEYSSFRDKSGQLPESENKRGEEYVPFSRPAVQEPLPIQSEEQAQNIIKDELGTPLENPGEDVSLENLPLSSKPSSKRGFLKPIVGYLVVFALVFVFGVFSPKGSAGYDLAVQLLTVLIMGAPVYIVFLVVRKLLLKSK